MSRKRNSGSDFMGNAVVAGFCMGLYGLAELMKFLCKMFLIGAEIKCNQKGITEKHKVVNEENKERTE